jgi:7,8-dihydropterin-6-yl-methyl-4-(beta-D-ribofuranosyl)aminobenzene 5'-phosphate synthase
MPTEVGFGDTADVTITILMDNRADLMVCSTETVKYFTDGPLLAEHGFSVLVHLREPDRRILWDAGLSEVAVLGNMRSLKADPASVDCIAISHGHEDHTAAVLGVLAAIDVTPESREWPANASRADMVAHAQGRRVPVVVHPAALHERWYQEDDGTWSGPHRGPPTAAWEAAGGQLVASPDPYRLAPGCWTTGFVPRRSFESSGLPKGMYYRDGEQLIPDALEDDQAIVIHLRGKGLVVLSGCAHSGIVNTVRRAQEISGVDRVHAVLGGFHLARASESELTETVEALRALRPAFVVPSHCTGFQAMAAFSAAMPEAFLPAVVGATYLF